MFDKKDKQNADSAGKDIVGFTKPKRFLGVKTRAKPIYGDAKAGAGATQSQTTTQQLEESMSDYQQGGGKKLNPMQQYIFKMAARHKGLDAALKEQQIKKSPYEFVKGMIIRAAIVTAVIYVAMVGLLIHFVMPIADIAVLPIVLSFAVFYVLLNKFIQYPAAKSKSLGKDVERDILFAARDMVVSMRSGMPLFNAMAAVSTGYGAASREFAKVVELVQLGMPIEQAMDEVSQKSQSKTFKRLMLQASVSIKAGADITTALQGVVEDVTNERVIDLRRYGQRLNALAMFYMLFGIIFPSMGIAVAAILTTFIAIFTVDNSTLILALIGITGVQVIFLNFMRASRPTFAM